MREIPQIHRFVNRYVLYSKKVATAILVLHYCGSRPLQHVSTMSIRMRDVIASVEKLQSQYLSWLHGYSRKYYKYVHMFALTESLL